MPSLGEIARKQGIKYFLISFVDLFGTMRAKIVPATAIDAVAKSGAGFAGFAVWYDMTPADPDILATPDSAQPDPAAVEARGRLGRRRPRDGRPGGGAESAPGAQARGRGRRQGGLRTSGPASSASTF